MSNAIPQLSQPALKHAGSTVRLEAELTAHDPRRAFFWLVMTDAQKLRSSSSSSINFREMFGSWAEASVDSKRSCKAKYQWPFQDPKLEVPTIYKAYIRPM